MHPLIPALIPALCTLVAPPDACELASPDGNVLAVLRVAEQGSLRYAVSYRGKPILADSRLGLTLVDAPALDEGFRIVGLSRNSHDAIWKPVYGERSQVRDRYHELTVDLEDRHSPPRRLRLALRAYDEGFAISYTIPKQPGIERVRIARENTQFRFTADHTAWAVYSAQGRYSQVRLSQIKPGCERPLVVRVDDDTYAALAEARLVDYARM